MMSYLVLKWLRSSCSCSWGSFLFLPSHPWSLRATFYAWVLAYSHPTCCEVEGLWGKSPTEARTMSTQGTQSAILLYPPAQGRLSISPLNACPSLCHGVALGDCSGVQKNLQNLPLRGALAGSWDPVYQECQCHPPVGKSWGLGFHLVVDEASSETDFVLMLPSLLALVLMMITSKNHHVHCVTAELLCVPHKDKGPDMMLMKEQRTLC